MRVNTSALRILVLATAAFLVGMSGLTPTGQTQETPSIFSARIMDVADHEVLITEATLDGKTLFVGYLGKGRVQIPFENILRIEISQGSASIVLEGGERVSSLRITGMSRLAGKTPFASYQIALKDLRWAELTKLAQVVDERP